MQKVTRHRVLILFGVLCLVVLLSAPVGAVPITTLFNTGVDAGGVVLPDSTIGDPHYALIGVPGGTTDIRIITAASGFPIVPGLYIGDNALSRWIGPNNDPDVNGPVGIYTYRTTFDLTGLNPSTAAIAGQWTTDNQGIGVLINGTFLSFPTPNNQFALGFSPFSITSGFVSGLNTLDFVVRNEAGPTALRVQMTGTADSLTSAVPEPATGVLLASGLASILTWRRRR
jgi:hypothetical protein